MKKLMSAQGTCLGIQESFLHKNEELCLDSQNPCKKPSIAMHLSVISALSVGRAETRESLSLFPTTLSPNLVSDPGSKERGGE